jgi:hypothetical protein
VYESSGSVSSAACLSANQGATYLIRVGQDFFNGGAVTQMVIETLETSAFALPSGAVREAEVCGAGETNGGCPLDGVNPLTEPLSLCVAGWGQLGSTPETGAPDVDTYRVSLVAGQTYVLDAQSDASALFWVATAESCDTSEILTVASTDAACYRSFQRVFTAPITGAYHVQIQYTSDLACGQLLTNYWVRVRPVAGCATPCSPSDVASSGQTLGADGQLRADDIIVFVNWFFSGDVRADIASSGQAAGADGQFTADDIILFVNRFFAGC